MDHQAPTAAHASSIDGTRHVARFSDLSDELVWDIFQHLNFEELSAAQCVDRRLYRLLSRPNPCIKVYGSCSLTMDKIHASSSLAEFTRYLMWPNVSFNCKCRDLICAPVQFLFAHVLAGTC